MSNFILTEKSNLVAVADAIRSKTGQTGQMTLNQMISSTNNFAGGIVPSGNISITENGSYDVSQYASAEVNVASSGGGAQTCNVTLSFTGNAEGYGEFGGLTKFYYTEVTSSGFEFKEIQVNQDSTTFYNTLLGGFCYLTSGDNFAAFGFNVTTNNSSIIHRYENEGTSREDILFSTEGSEVTITVS